MNTPLSRRAFLQVSTSALGGLLVGAHWPTRTRAASVS